jgi:predicted ABC-type ATPase
MCSYRCRRKNYIRSRSLSRVKFASRVTPRRASISCAGRSFAFETTLAGHSYVRRIDAWRKDGYLVELIFLSLPSPEDAVRRVAERVKQGGHNVTEDVIRRRFTAGMRHFLEIYRHRVDYWMWFDNSGREPVLIEEGK